MSWFSPSFETWYFTFPCLNLSLRQIITIHLLGTISEGGEKWGELGSWSPHKSQAHEQLIDPPTLAVPIALARSSSCTHVCFSKNCLKKTFSYIIWRGKIKRAFWLKGHWKFYLWNNEKSREVVRTWVEEVSDLTSEDIHAAIVTALDFQVECTLLWAHLDLCRNQWRLYHLSRPMNVVPDWHHCKHRTPAPQDWICPRILSPRHNQPRHQSKP